MVGGHPMKHTVSTLALMMAIAVAAFGAGSWWVGRGSVGAVALGAEARHGYVCPMHPHFTSDRPGACPACGMRLVAADGAGGPNRAASSAAEGTMPGASIVPGTVHVDAEMQRRVGVTVAEVRRVAAAHAVRLVGRVVPDETRTYSVTAGTNGFVRDISTVTTGARVREGEYLASVSVPSALLSMQSYLVALGAIDRLSREGAEGVAQARTSEASANFQQRLETLQDLGMSEVQIAEIRRTRELPKILTVHSPADGVVLARNISVGQRFERGMDWYRIADLTHVWIQAEVIGTDAEYVRPGMRVKVSVPGGRTFLDAHVSVVPPQFDPATRTLKVRLEASNPGYVLRPDMVVDVEVPVVLPPAIVVPVDAILDSGVRKTVFVERGEGVFEPREVRTSWRFGDRAAIAEGLTAGERIATSGTFLIDSESRMRLAATPLARTANR
jgi:Cu(I)/Ag(I) efflux system membrane fusion protein